jgi:hypothetical protein
MSALDTLIAINISQQTATIPTASFAIPLIIGPTVPTTGGILQAYTSPAGMLTNGYTTSSPEYVRALELYEQPITPSEFYVGQRLAAVAQVDTLAVNNLVSGHVYSFTLNGVLISYTSTGLDTQQSILTALNAAIAAAFPLANPVAGVVSGAGAGALLTLTSVAPGAGVSYLSIDSDLTHVAVTPNHGIADDLAAFIALNNTWYGIVLCSNVDSDILQLAAAVEALVKVFFPVSNDAAIATNSVTDIASVMKGKGYKRTVLMFSPASFNLGIEAAWVGGQLPQTPGSNNWAYQSLDGISPDNLSDAQRAILVGDPVAQIAGKNVNIYTTVGGVNITQMGTAIGGQFIDITIGIDWLKSTLQTNIFQALLQSAKIPYTDKGTTVLMSAVKAAIDQGVTNGLIDGASPISITAPPVLSVPSNQRAARVAPTISFSCRLAGAFNAVVIDGTVTV